MLSETEKMELLSFKELLKKELGNEILGIRLFGSKARGDDHPESDIDVMVMIRHEDWRIKEKIGKAATRILLAHNVYLSVKVFGKMTLHRLRLLKSPFLRDVSRHGIRI